MMETTWLPWQSDSIAQIDKGEDFAISAARQSGKTAIALDVAEREALCGKEVLYVTNSYMLAIDACQKVASSIRSKCPRMLTRVRTATYECGIATAIGGSIRFLPYASRSLPMHECDRMICDDYPLGRDSIPVVRNRGPALYAGLGEMPEGVQSLRLGASVGDDIDDEATWYRAHPGLGTIITIEQFRRAHRALSRSHFASEMLNLDTKTVKVERNDMGIPAACH